MAKKSWHTKSEYRLLKSLKAKPHHPGYDGILPDGRPIEIRECKKQQQFRIQKDVHLNLLRQSGVYVFKKNGTTKKLTAQQVNRLLGTGKWWTDRSYPYKHLSVAKVFRGYD